LRVKSCISPLVNRVGGRLLSCRSCRFSCRIEWHANTDNSAAHRF
jgi:hypothetical protein